MPDRDEPAGPTGTGTGTGAAASTVTGRDRLRALLRSRPGRGQAVVGVALAVVGFAAAVQVQVVDSDSPYAGARRSDLVELLQTVSAAQDRTEAQLADLERTRRALEESSAQREVALQEAREQLRTLQVLSGAVGARGPGVRITIDDPGNGVGAAILLDCLEELRDAGAEAIEVNDRARVVAQTPLTDADGGAGAGVVVGDTTLTAPYVVDAIGPAEVLAGSVDFPGGLLEQVQAVGGTVTVETPDEVLVTELAPQPDTDYVDPSS